MNIPWKAATPLIGGAIIFFLPTPSGLEPYAWHYFALFVAVVIGLILEPIPAGAVGLVGITLAAIFTLVPLTPGTKPTLGQDIQWALSGFSNGTIWLIFVAFMFAMGYEKTGLGRRIALLLIKKLGRSSLGLGYAVAASDLILAPFIPSNSARTGGTVFPIIKNIPPLYGCTPEQEPRRIGGYIMWVALCASCITSSMFLTALSPNLLALSIVEKTTKFTITWLEWFMYFLPVGVILFFSMPYLVYKIYPPTIKTSEETPKWAGQELTAMGPMAPKELVMGALALMALILWIFGSSFIDPVGTALLALCLMVITRVVTWEDIISYKAAWSVFFWLATLVTMADGLNKVGFLKWYAALAAASMSGFSMSAVIIGLVAIFFLIHYFFASITSHATALLPVFVATGMAIPGMHVKLLVILLCTSLGIMGIITPYGTGPSPIFYGSGYIGRKEFWFLGFVFGMIFLGVHLLVGFPYLMYVYKL